MGVLYRIGDIGYPVGLVINIGTIGPVTVPLGQNIMAVIGYSTRGPAMQVIPLTSYEEVEKYFGGGPLVRAGKLAFANGLPVLYCIKVAGTGHAAARKYCHDGLIVSGSEDFYGDGTVGPYNLEHKYYVQDASNSIHKGNTAMNIVYTGTPAAGEVLLNTEEGTLTFHTGEGPTATDHVTCTLKHYNNVGRFQSPNDGIIGNDAWVEVDRGTFVGHDVEDIAGNGEATYALKFHDLVQSSQNTVYVGGNKRTPVYSSGDLAAGKVYINCSNGEITFFAGEEPTTSDIISVNIEYYTRKITVHDGDTAYPVIDNLPDLVAIQAALIYDSVANFIPDEIATHLPAVGSYQLAGGSDGAAITTDDWVDACDVLIDYELDTSITCTTMAFTEYEVDPGTYDLLPVLDGKLREKENNFVPSIGFFGLKPNEVPATARRVVSNFANRNLVVVANPWDNAQPYRQNAIMARAAMEAAAPLGMSTARRKDPTAIKGLSMGTTANSANPMALLNVYRRETVKMLHYGRLDVLVKTNAGIFSFYARGTGGDHTGEAVYSECVENRTVNYVIGVAKYITDQFLFEKNTPSERSSLKESIAKVMDRLTSDEVVNKYNLSVDSGRAFNRPGDVNVHLDAENVNHIKIVNMNYNNGLVS